MENMIFFNNLNDEAQKNFVHGFKLAYNVLTMKHKNEKTVQFISNILNYDSSSQNN